MKYLKSQIQSENIPIFHQKFSARVLLSIGGCKPLTRSIPMHNLNSIHTFNFPDFFIPKYIHFIIKFFQIVLIGFALNGFFGGLWADVSAPDGKSFLGGFPTSNLYYCLSMTMSICFASILYNKRFSSMPRWIYVAFSILPGVAICLTIDRYSNVPTDISSLVLLTILAAADYQVTVTSLVIFDIVSVIGS